MAIFHCYVSSPEGNPYAFTHGEGGVNGAELPALQLLRQGQGCHLHLRESGRKRALLGLLGGRSFPNKKQDESGKKLAKRRENVAKTLGNWEKVGKMLGYNTEIPLGNQIQDSISFVGFYIYTYNYPIKAPIPISNFTYGIKWQLSIAILNYQRVLGGSSHL